MTGEDTAKLNEAAEQLKQSMKMFGGVEKIAEFVENTLPKDRFTAEIDGHIITVSRGFSGKAILIEMQDDIKCGSLFQELQSNKKGFFKRIFKK